jgi:hypothetical protein
MLISVDEPYWNSSVAASMSQTYLQHFAPVTKSGAVPGAFHVLERVRGRTLAWALEDRKAFPSANSGQTASLETDLAGLQVQLMQTNRHCVNHASPIPSLCPGSSSEGRTSRGEAGSIFGAVGCFSTCVAVGCELSRLRLCESLPPSFV